jgi:hypothetical protein
MRKPNVSEDVQPDQSYMTYELKSLYLKSNLTPESMLFTYCHTSPQLQKPPPPLAVHLLCYTHTHTQTPRRKQERELNLANSVLLSQLLEKSAVSHDFLPTAE